MRAAIGDFSYVVDEGCAYCEVEPGKLESVAGDSSELVDFLCNRLRDDYGISVMYRVLTTPIKSGVVVQVACPGMEAFHHVRSMIPCEPVGRLRSPMVLDACRKTVA